MSLFRALCIILREIACFFTTASFGPHFHFLFVYALQGSGRKVVVTLCKALGRKSKRGPPGADGR